MAWWVRGQAPPKAWAETSTGDAAWTSQKPHPEEISREGEGGKQALWKLIRTAGNVPGWQEVMRFPLPRPSPFRAVVSRGPCLGGGGTFGGREGRRVTGSSWPTSGTAFFLPRAPARSRNLRACPPQAQAGSRCSPVRQEPRSCLSSALGFRLGILPGVEPGEGGGLQGLAILPLLVKLIVPCFPLTSSSARRREQRSRARPLHTRTLIPDLCVRASLPFFACKLGAGGGDGF